MRKFRLRDYVGAPTTCFGASECKFGDSVSVREIVTRFTSQVIEDEFKNKDFFYDFDISQFSRVDDFGNVSFDADSFVKVCDKFIPVRNVDIEAAGFNERIEYYKSYIKDAKQYFRDKEVEEKERKLAELRQMEEKLKNLSDQSAKGGSPEDMENE